MDSRVLNRLSGGLGGDVRVHTRLSGTWNKGERSFIFGLTTGVHGNPGHDKTPTHFVHFSPSIMPIWDISSTYGKLRLRRIQRRELQEVWWRTRRERRVLPRNQSTGLDKEY
jgi:hypothetical protein